MWTKIWMPEKKTPTKKCCSQCMHAFVLTIWRLPIQSKCLVCWAREKRRAEEKTHIKYSTAMYSIKIYFPRNEGKNEHTSTNNQSFFLHLFLLERWPCQSVCCHAFTVCVNEESFPLFSSYFFARYVLYAKLCLTFFCRFLCSKFVIIWCVCGVCVYSPYISIFLHVFKFVSIKYIIEWSGI